MGQQFCKWSLFHYQQRLRTTARCSSILVVPYPFLSSFFPKQILTQMHFHTGIFHLHWNFVHFSIDNSTHLRIALYFGNFLKLISVIYPKGFSCDFRCEIFDHFSSKSKIITNLNFQLIFLIIAQNVFDC